MAEVGLTQFGLGKNWDVVLTRVQMMGRTRLRMKKPPRKPPARRTDWNWLWVQTMVQTMVQTIEPPAETMY